MRASRSFSTARSSRYGPPERLVFTFRWERGDWDYPETLVSIDFTGEGGETTLTLTHEGFPDENMRDEHQGGWVECLNNLGAYLGG